MRRIYHIFLTTCFSGFSLVYERNEFKQQKNIFLLVCIAFNQFQFQNVKHVNAVDMDTIKPVQTKFSDYECRLMKSRTDDCIIVNL